MVNKVLKYGAAVLFARPATYSEKALSRMVFPAKFAFLIAVTLLVLALPSSASTAPPVQSPGEVQIPSQSDWTDHGTILSQGVPGSWDARLEGAISPATMVKKNGTYFLYYIGANGDRSTDGGPRHRALGVATSNDGINFTSYGGNPVITHLPHDNQEEGVFSAAATRDSNGDIVLHYGALWAADSTTENVDIYFDLATSTDGLNFNNPPGYVRQNTGREEDPVGVLRANGNWYVYFIDNESGWDLKLLSSSLKDNLTSLTSLLTSGTDIIGGGDPAPIAPDRVALFLVRDFKTWQVEVRTAPVSAPHQLSAPVETYDFPNMLHSLVYLDLETNTWFMYYLNGAGDGIGVKTAPATVVGGDTTPPTAPTGLTAIPISETRIDLSWSSDAIDPESGIASYKVYRDGMVVGTPTGTSFSDTGLSEGVSYSYEVSAVNGAGIEGPRSSPPVNQSTPSKTNQAPANDAGLDQTVAVGSPATASLQGTASDDGLPNPPGSLSHTWSVASGPATVSFGSPNALATTATFSQACTYVLRLTTSDSEFTATDEVTITVTPGPTLTSITVSPASASVHTGSSFQFTAQGLDQNGDPFHISPSWSVSGGGSIDQSGLFTGGSTEGGPFTVTAAQGSVSGTAQVSVTGGQLVVSDLSVASGKSYVVDTSGVSAGGRVYIDRTYTYSTVPPAIEGAVYIRTANNDKNAANTSFLSFSVNQDVKVYVVYDVRGTPAQGGSLPNWLTSWTDTGLTMGTTDMARRVYSRDFVAGTVSLGGNMAAGARGAESNYTVVIVP